MSGCLRVGALALASVLTLAWAPAAVASTQLGIDSEPGAGALQGLATLQKVDPERLIIIGGSSLVIVCFIALVILQRRRNPPPR